MGNDNVKDYPPYLDYPKPRKPQTNADKLRAMSDEELAKFIEQYELHEAWSFHLDGRTWLDWLRQEAQP